MGSVKCFRAWLSPKGLNPIQHEPYSNDFPISFHQGHLFETQTNEE